MIKEALQWIADQAKIEQFKFGDIEYTSKSLYPVKNEKVEALGITTLAGFVEFASLQKADEVMVQVEDYNEAVLVSKDIDKFNDRQCLATAKINRNKFMYGHQADVEHFLVQLQAQFEPTDDRDKILKVIGNIKESTVKGAEDDGISQTVTVKQGISMAGEAKVPNPVTLKPFRTFPEIEQPESLFVFRMKSGFMCSLHEADGDEWQVKAIESIKEYLKKALPAITVIG